MAASRSMGWRVPVSSLAAMTDTSAVQCRDVAQICDRAVDLGQPGGGQLC